MIKVMVVDDDHLVRKGFIAMMPWREHNLEVVGEAGNGKKALEFLENNQVDLLITDLAMPVMSGIDLMRCVKERYRDISMVVLTFHQDFELIQEALRLGALDYMTKVELEHEQMDEILRRIVGKMQEQHVRTRETKAEIQGIPTFAEEDEGPYSPEVKASIWKAVDIIHQEFQNELLLPDIAKRVNMSRSYFSRCFRDIAGKTFNDYIREVRVNHAKVLLCQKGKTISWIATQAGYPNEKYFSKVFRELTGMLPGEYRKSHS
ncbi:helix-turn-helix domain-containing protein [Paenibacillus sp. LMG 31460]|uniref:Helix-turn-helix domain-containing protein n=1 Tax=Paenibacillus germinis TaxID=2654979 RepID=A0ABX1YT11_9BACL|nr:helix-turn-helix domain-containing protein [Paenibacillus germinis]NOU84220.1 helix-turn-helix domain-containing protein [Paenibacillus germinis]